MTKPLQRKSSEPETPWRPEPKKYGVWALYIAFALGLIAGAVITGWVAIDAFTKHPPSAHPASYAPSSPPAHHCDYNDALKTGCTLGSPIAFAAQKTQDDGKCTEGHVFHMHDYKLGDSYEVCRHGKMTPHKADDGFGVCPAFQHPHDYAPGKCFDNDDHEVLPKPAPQFKPGKEPLV